MKYNQYSYETIKKLIAKGQKYASKGYSINDVLYAEDFSESQWEFVQMGLEHPDFVPGEIKTFYRIGEPREDGYGCYKNSYNFAEDRFENGVSVVTAEWLHNLKSVFFGTSDKDIEAKGVYKIRGFVVPNIGGDDETLICPMDWAEKTRIRTRNGLEKAVKNIK
ncbi:MAG: hypothetical protein MR278_01810 [Bacteroidales bacterium]|nr:hypothetical protein [Anaerotignum sp.]MCI5678711.1 hypothetical protein [Bacteroidales bacterium]MDY3925929.1 hypothetical protein [Anaerotignum sp.]